MVIYTLNMNTPHVKYEIGSSVWYVVGSKFKHLRAEVP